MDDLGPDTAGSFPGSGGGLLTWWVPVLLIIVYIIHRAMAAVEGKVST